jgi:hypothetical protein
VRENLVTRRNSPTIYVVNYQLYMNRAYRHQEALSQNGSGSSIEDRAFRRALVRLRLHSGLSKGSA